MDHDLASMVKAANLGTEPTIPKGHGTYSYYNAQTALRIKALLDEMRSNPTHNVHIDSGKYRIKPKTLMQWYKQGLGYLIANHDTNGVYREMCRGIAAKIKQDGLLLVWLHLVSYDPAFIKGSVTHVSQHIADMYVWREKLQQFVEYGLPGERLSLTGIHLTNDDIEKTRSALVMCSHVTFELSNTKLEVTLSRDPLQARQVGSGIVLTAAEAGR